MYRTTERRARAAALLGFAAVVVYVTAVVIGGATYRGYSHLHNAISALTAVGSAVRGQVEPLFAIYNLALLAFAMTLRSPARDGKRCRHLERPAQRLLRAGALALHSSVIDA